MTKPKTLDQRRIEWKEQWISENIPSGEKYNPFLHKRIPRSPELKKLENYAYKLVKDGLDNKTINERLQKYRKTQLCDEDINEIREDVAVLVQEKRDDKKRVEITNQIDLLEMEHHKIFNEYMHNVQSPYLQIERIIVKEHCCEYPEYMELMKKQQKYLEEDKILQIKIDKLKNQINKLEI